MPIPPGTPAPAALALALDGAPVDLAALAARGPALLFFYKGDCPASPLGARVLPRLGAIPGLAVAAIAQDGPAEAQAFAAEHGWAPPVRTLVDPEPWPASDAFGVLVTPTWVLLVPGGAVAAVAEGWSRDEVNALAARAAALAGAPPVAVSRPEEGDPAWRPG